MRRVKKCMLVDLSSFMVAARCSHCHHRCHALRSVVAASGLVLLGCSWAASLPLAACALASFFFDGPCLCMLHAFIVFNSSAIAGWNHGMRATDIVAVCGFGM